MSESVQHIIVYLIVGLCVLAILYQAFGSWFGRKSLIGKCCERGCNPNPTSPAGKEQFIPVESLSRKQGGA